MFRVSISRFTQFSRPFSTTRPIALCRLGELLNDKTTSKTNRNFVIDILNVTHGPHGFVSEKHFIATARLFKFLGREASKEIFLALRMKGGECEPNTLIRINPDAADVLRHVTATSRPAKIR